MPPNIPRHLELPGFVERWRSWLSANLNFYRVHMLCFTIIPLIFSGIMYACNTQIQIPYIDCLFVCFSAMCVTGLATINLSTLSTFQQFILYFQMLIGSTIFVSIIMVSVRRHFFRVQFRHVLKERDRKHRAMRLAKTLTRIPTTQPISALRRRFTRRPEETEHDVSGKSTPDAVPAKKKAPGKLTKDMIQRIDGGGIGMVNPMGWYAAGGTPTPSAGASRVGSRVPSPDPDDVKVHGAEIDHINYIDGEAHPMQTVESPGELSPIERAVSESSTTGAPSTTGSEDGKRQGSNEDAWVSPSYRLGAELGPVQTNDSLPAVPTGPVRSTTEPTRTPYAGLALSDDAFPRSKTIAFDDVEDGLDHELHLGRDREPGFFARTPTMRSDNDGLRRVNTTGSEHPYDGQGLRRTQSRFIETKNTGYGGFPTPIQLIGDLVHKVFPQTSTKLHQSITMPRTNTISGRGSVMGDGAEVPYISFSATVGRNSKFQNLTQEQMDELGGVEYRALRLLFWVVLSYWICLPLAGACIIAPYINAGNRYADVFNEQPKHVRIPWFAFFQATSAFSNTGVSLVDKSMVPFQTAYLMSVVVMLLILLGNTCFPIMLRFILWSMYKMVPATSNSHESLKFLLDHPRRCFIYLFPSTHTWFLLIIVFVLTMIDWWSFLVLDRGNEVIDSLPYGTRLAAGLFQSCAVRAAGFVIVNMNAVAPAVKVLYVLMMYISVYPIAMSVRATNVYEERALGLFEEEDPEDEEEDEEMQHTEGASAVAKYLGWHARRQLAFDMWWIALALWLVCIIERGALSDPANYEWMNIFNIIFELVSAYGTVGLSLGLPYDNYSLCGSFRTLSKLVFIVVMLRGRHRGLPVAIDRAVMLPKDFTESDERAMEDRLRRSRSRRASSYGGDFLSQTGSQMPHTFTMATDGAGQYGFTSMVQPPSPRLPVRRDSTSSMRRGDPSTAAPGPIRVFHRRTGSTASVDGGSPMTPTTLHFSLNTQGGGHQAHSGSPTNYAGMFPGSSLAPVPESVWSRRNTETDTTNPSTGSTATAVAPDSPVSTGPAAESAVTDSPEGRDVADKATDSNAQSA